MEHPSDSEDPAQPHTDADIPGVLHNSLAAEPNNTAEDAEAWADNVASDSKKSSLYATAPRSKSKELSYSELDLRKPRRFATFSFGLKKRKKKDEENLSKSTFGLHSPAIDEQEETTMDLSQMELDQANVKTMFMFSQPELDTCKKFDIPSPPPVATNQSESYFTIPDQSESVVTVNTQKESQEPPNVSDPFDVNEDLPKAPIASIPELQLDDKNISALDISPRTDAKSPAPLTDGISVADTQNAPGLSASRPPDTPHTSDQNAAVTESVSETNGPCDNDVLQQSHTKTEVSPPEYTRVPLSHHQPEASDSTTQSAHSKTDATFTESTLVPRTDDSAPSTDSATIPEEVSVSHTERSSFPEAAKSVTAAWADGSGKRPGQDVVYEALYESLFPQSFTSEVMSSHSYPPPPPPLQIHTERKHVNTKLEPVMVKTLNECHTETNVIYSHLSSSHDHRLDDAQSRYTNTHVNPNDFQMDANIYRTSSLCSASEPVVKDIPYSDLTRSLSHVRSDGFGLIHDTVRSVPVVQNPPPPVSEYASSHGAESRVTDSKQRVILVKELVTEEVSADSGCASPVLDRMSAIKSLNQEIYQEITIETPEFSYAASGSGPTEGSEGPLSPAYLSVGSDDGSVMEVYYSAEENNEEESGEEEMYTVDEKPEVDGLKEREWEEVIERGRSKRDEGEFRVVIVKMQSEEGNEDDDGNKVDLIRPTEEQQQPRGHMEETQVRESETSDLFVSSDAKRQETEVSTAALPQIEEEEEGEEEEGEEELLATPVRQVMECELAPPSSEPPHVQGEWSDRNWTRDLETEDHLNEEKQLLSQEPRYQVYEDVRSRGCEPAAPSNTGEEDVITSTCRQEQVSPCEDERGEASIEINSSVIADPSAGAEVLTGISTQSTELRSNATEIEHNRDQQSSEWEDTITGSADKKRTVQEQVGVELSTLTEDTHRPDSEPEGAFSEGHEPPSEGEPDLDPGSPTASKTDAAASESPKTNADQDTFDKMSSGYSSLSTKLTSRNLYPLEEDESQQRFHKVSLITEADGRGQDRVDSMESNGGDVDSEYMWKNRFEGVSQYRPYKVQDLIFSDSQIYTTSDTYSSTSSSSSAFPEATVYKHLSDTLSSTASSPAPEERFTLSNRLRDETQVYLSHESESAGEAKDEWRRSVVEREEPAAPASEGERQREGEAERESRWDSQHLPVSGFSSALHTSHIDGFTQDDDESSEFTGLFKATLVQLDGEPTAPLPTPPASPDTDSSNQLEMDNLVDTLKNMGPSFRPRCTGLRPPAPALMSSLPPIVEDAPSPITPDIPASLTSPVKKMESNGTDSLDGIFTLPPDLGLKRHPRDTRSPLELLKTQQDQQPGTRGLNLPLRASAANSIVLRRSSDSSLEDLKSPMLNGNGISPPSNTGSRLDNSIIYGSYRSSTIDQTTENEKAHRPLFRTSSLPDTGPLSDRLSMGQKDLGDLAGSRFERFSFLANSSSSSGSLTGAEDLNGRMSRPPPPSFGSPPSSNSPTRLLSPTGSIDLHRPFTTTDSALSMFGQTQGMGVGAGTAAPPLLQRSLSSDGTMGVQQTSRFNNVHGGSLFQSKEPEPERNQVSKYRAFPDAYLTKEKEHGKLNPRPGKMYIFDRPGMCGQRIEVRSDVIDATSWDLQEIISIRVVRGGWVMYEKPNFKGDKLALDEGDIELSSPFSPPEEQLQNGQKEEEGGKEQNGETSDEPTESTPARRFIIGSLRRAVRDYSVPEISLFPEENAEGKKVIFRDTSDDARIFGFPIKANSIIINAGLWLVYAQPFFQGVPRVLEVGGYSNPAAWGVEHPYVGSLHPLKVGEPRVENLSEPKLMIFEKPYFCGKSRTINSNMRDFMTRVDRQQTAFMYSVGSLKVQGGIWVGYEKDGFRGHQYLLEEGEYQDWRVWGGRDAELRSVRVIQADLTEPMMVMFEQPEEEQENMQEESTFEVTEAIPDVELFGYKTSTRSIHVLSGAWVAYSHVDYSGDQYILEKGFYNNSADWGSEDTRICSVQPILLAPSDNSRTRNQLVLYSEPDFQGKCDVFDRNQEALSEKFLTKSCRVAGGSWVLYENEKHSGNLYVLHEGDYPNLISMGCPPSCSIRSVKVVPTTFSVPSLSLFGLECLEGREITTETEIISMAGEGFNNHILSVRVNSGSWVLYEHSHYRGRQFLLEPIEITNWPKFSSLCTIGSVYPVRQKRQFFRIKNAESGHPMSVQGGVEEMKSGRVVVTAEVEPMTDIWFYQDGFIKNKLSKTMSLQVMGNIEPAAKVVLWSETRQPIQTWVTQMRGLITNLTFPGMVMDVKGGKTYDKDHVVIMPENDERPSQQWEIELL
nr:PREDICTED: uncharacterized protein LOC109639985 [Paralichthys olivaceus]